MPDLLAKCGVCGGVIDEEDLFCANCGTEAPRVGEAKAQAAHLSTHNFTCKGCGASMSYDASAGSLRCPFCGSLDLVNQQDAKVLKPETVVPFSIEKEQAIEQMRRWLGNSFWRPGDLAQRAEVTSMTPVYVPYWVFSARTHTHWTADTSQTPPGARGDWFPLFGERRGQCNGLLVAASGALLASETAALSPFDLAAGVDPAQVDLERAIYEQFGLARKHARPLASQGIDALEAAACEREVPGRARNVKVNVRVEDLSSAPVLLPVWIMAYRYRGDLYRFLVNGQTGQATGRAPLSYLRILAAVGLGVLAVLLLMLLFAAFAGFSR